MAFSEEEPAESKGEQASEVEKCEKRRDVSALVPGPSQILAEVFHEDPEMVLYRHFVSPEEVEHLIQLAEGRWQRSTTSRAKASVLHGTRDTAGHGVETKGDVRTSSSVFFDFSESPVVERIAARVATVAGLPLAHVEPMALIRYRPGEYFKQHHDGSMRAKTVFVYLNDVAPGNGGETYFPKLGLKIAPRACTAVLWGNRSEDGSADRRMDHEALPLTGDGEDCVKYGMNCFVNVDPQRDTSHIRVVKVDAETGEPASAPAPGEAEAEATAESGEGAANADGAEAPGADSKGGASSA